MTKKKENKKEEDPSKWFTPIKKKEDPYVKYAKPRDLTIENWNSGLKDNMDVVWTHRIKAEVIDCPPTVIATFPKELACAGLGCAIYNALERERGSNVVWRIG